MRVITEHVLKTRTEQDNTRCFRRLSKSRRQSEHSLRQWTQETGKTCGPENYFGPSKQMMLRAEFAQVDHFSITLENESTMFWGFLVLNIQRKYIQSGETCHFVSRGVDSGGKNHWMNSWRRIGWRRVA